MDKKHRVNKVISDITSSLGSIPAIILSVSLIIGWFCTGPLFGFSDAWSLAINTITTIVTFMMVFIIQNSQNRDGRAIQTKLDAIIDILCDDPDKDLLTIEDKTEKEIREKDEQIINRGGT